MEAYHITGAKLPDDVYYANYFKAMDGDESKIELADSTPDGGGLILPGFIDVGRPIKPDFVPTKLRRTGPGIKQNPLLDFNMWRANTLLVPQVFKDILEELEPGIHQFFPMEYYQKKDKIGEGYWFIFGQRLDTLHDTACVPGRNERGFPIRTKRGEESKVVYSAAKINGYCAWVDKFQHGRNISGEFAERLRAENLTGLNYNPMIVE